MCRNSETKTKKKKMLYVPDAEIGNIERNM